MINHYVDLLIIGGGPAGLAAAVSAKTNGLKDIVIIDRNRWLGGILPQCIHDGFGVEETGISMTGPEYAEMYIKKVMKNNISIFFDTMVLEFNKKNEIIAINKKGLHKIVAKAIVLAMGCREKTRWDSMIPGDRPSGIFTAGVVQTFINLYNLMPGKNVIILGSGDVGLIIARRLKFEGANVLGVIEMLSYASGLPRNVIQCLDDYDIPLFLNHTITYIKGKKRLEGITIAKLDKDMNIISGSEKDFQCDTLILSLGLIPENELSKKGGVEIDEFTGGPIVNQFYQTSINGIFACGNCLQVYDTVDTLAIDAKYTGMCVANHVFDRKNNDNYYVKINVGEGIRYIIPQIISKGGLINFTFRVEQPLRSAIFRLNSGKNVIFSKKLSWVNPANMIRISVDITQEMLDTTKNFEVSIHER